MIQMDWITLKPSEGALDMGRREVVLGHLARYCYFWEGGEFSFLV